MSEVPDSHIYVRIYDKKYKPHLVIKIGRTSQPLKRDKAYARNYTIKTKYHNISTKKFLRRVAGTHEKSMKNICLRHHGKSFNANKDPRPDREWFEFSNVKDYIEALKELDNFITEKNE